MRALTTLKKAIYEIRIEAYPPEAFDDYRRWYEELDVDAYSALGFVFADTPVGWYFPD